MANLSFAPGGNRLVYSNHPESIKGTTLKGKGVYTIETALTPNYAYIHDFYHHNETGSPIIVGVAVKNTTSSTITLRVQRATTGKGAAGSGKSISSDMHKRYNNASTAITNVPIAGGATQWISGAYSTLSAGQLLNGRVSLNAAASGLKSRIVAIPTSTAVGSIFSLPRADNDGMLRTTALFNYDTRYANINMNTHTEYTFCGRTSDQWAMNANEFPHSATDKLAGTNCLPNNLSIGDFLCDGNFSVYYIFNLQNTGDGKYITFKPGYDASGTYAMQTDSAWVTQVISKTDVLKLNTKNISTIKFVLTGGNTGNIKITV